MFHQPSGLYDKEEDKYYNAFEKDIAVVHFFFQVTVRVESFVEIMLRLRLMSLVIVLDHKLLQANYGLRPHYFQSFGPVGFHPKLNPFPRRKGGN